MSQKYSVGFPEHKHIIELRIENFSSCPVLEGERIECPESTADGLFGTVWVFGIYPRGKPGFDPNYLACSLKREANEFGPRKLHIELEVSVVTVEGVKVFTKSGSAVFMAGDAYHLVNFVKVQEIFSRKEFILHLDILILRCELRLLPPEVRKPSLHTFKSTFPIIVKTSRLLEMNNFHEINKQNPMILKFKELDNLLLLKVSMNRDKTFKDQIQEKAVGDKSPDDEPTPTQFHLEMPQEEAVGLQTYENKIQKEAVGSQTYEDKIQKEAVGSQTYEDKIQKEAVGSQTYEDKIQKEAVELQTYENKIQKEAVGSQTFENQIGKEAVGLQTLVDQIRKEAVEKENTWTPESYLHMVMIKNKSNHPVYVAFWIMLLNKNRGIKIERELAHRFTKKGKEEWILPHFIDTNTLGDDCIDDGTLYLKFVFTFYCGKPDSILEGFFTPLKLSEDPMERWLLDLYQTKKFSDVTLKVGDEKFEAHKSVLAARSSKFEEIFTNLVKEGDDSENHIVEIVDVDKDTMELVLKFIYTNQLEDLDAERSLLIYTAAHKYKILSLQFKCLNSFREKLALKTVCPLLVVADKYKDPEMKMMAIDYIVKHDQQVLLTPEWQDITKEHKKLSNQVMRQIRLTKEMEKDDWKF